MDAEVKQRNRRRKRAQRMQQAAQRESKVASKDGDSGEEDSECALRREKPPRPPIRRKKVKEPIVEEDIIDGFSILGFKSYDDLESIVKIAGKDVKRFLDEKPSRHEARPHVTHHLSVHQTPVHTLTLTHLDPGTSDDSGRASERLTSSSVAPRDADSSRDRLSDASSRCSSGKGYICDSEGEDDKGSDASSVIFGSAPASRKHELPGALPPSLPPSNGASNSPVPAPTPPNLPAPSPAPAQLPPPSPFSNQRTGTTTTGPAATVTPVNTIPSGGIIIPSSTAVPTITMPQPAAAPVAHHPPAFVSTTNHVRTESPAVATSANVAVAPGGNGAAGGQYHHSTFQPLYAPYAVHSTYTSQSPAPPVSVTTTTIATIPSCPQPVTTVATTLPISVTNHRDVMVSKTISPKGHSPSRERESYSSNVSSLSRSSVTPISCPPPTTISSSLAMSKSWSGTTPQLNPAPPRPTPPLHSSFSSSMFAAPLPPPATTASSLTTTVPSPAPNPNPFSAESLFQSNQADILRRELDNRFLASQDRTMNIGPPPYLRAEMHQHQHHHTHVHQHTTSILPPPPTASTLFPSPLYKDIPKLGSIDSPFYRQNIGLPGYPTYSPGLLHPGLTGPTPFVPPNHLPPFQPKPAAPQPDPTKPKIVKSGKWNAMHVRIAWEVYHHQQKETKGSAVKPDLLRTPSHLFPPSAPFSRSHDLSFPPSLNSHRPPSFEQPHPTLFGSTGPHIGSTLSPFARYGAGFSTGSSPFSVSPLVSRDLPLGLHDPWRGLQRTVPVFPPSVNSLPPSVGGLGPPAPWSLKPDPVLEQREREERERVERERERLRREREERERREREEKQRKLEQQQQERERERREKERRELERRELERQERERLLHQQRLVESTKQLMPPMMRDRSPLRNGAIDHNEIRIKEEPRIKEEDRYHSYMRQHHPGLQHAIHPMMDRSRVLPPPYPPPPTTHWPPSPADAYYRTYEPLRYNPLVDAAMRAEEERVKFLGAYSHHAHFRSKDPGLLHLRAGSGPGPPPPTRKLCPTPPTDLHKNEEPR